MRCYIYEDESNGKEHEHARNFMIRVDQSSRKCKDGLVVSILGEYDRKQNRGTRRSTRQKLKRGRSSGRVKEQIGNPMQRRP
jgi:hypothetical protein